MISCTYSDANTVWHFVVQLNDAQSDVHYGQGSDVAHHRHTNYIQSIDFNYLQEN